MPFRKVSELGQGENMDQTQLGLQRKWIVGGTGRLYGLEVGRLNILNTHPRRLSRTYATGLKITGLKRNGCIQLFFQEKVLPFNILKTQNPLDNSFVYVLNLNAVYVNIKIYPCHIKTFN